MKTKQNTLADELGMDEWLIWVERIAEQEADLGLQEDGSWVRLRTAGTPSRAAHCPNHRNVFTSWRGPMPGRGDAPMVERSDRRSYVVETAEGTPRVREASRLWRIADRWAKEPAPMGEHHVIWQAGPCVDCLDVKQERWLDAIWPPPPKKKARGAMIERNEGDWDL